MLRVFGWSVEKQWDVCPGLSRKLRPFFNENFRYFMAKKGFICPLKHKTDTWIRGYYYNMEYSSWLHTNTVFAKLWECPSASHILTPYSTYFGGWLRNVEELTTSILKFLVNMLSIEWTSRVLIETKLEALLAALLTLHRQSQAATSSRRQRRSPETWR